MRASRGAVKGGGGDTPGKWFFNESLIGDVVVVKNSKDETVKPDNGLNGLEHVLVRMEGGQCGLTAGGAKESAAPVRPTAPEPRAHEAVLFPRPWATHGTCPRSG
ncbi:hypothetical protein OG229_04550 [Streptomyces platensis]|uniref:hypothetical protein n=1 Tax=Streptomyces platensis TaxID=58346 RepID=UPI002E102C85|nr:hypothetical protein OG229_04550 [Streptomyces platensis]